MLLPCSKNYIRKALKPSNHKKVFLQKLFTKSYDSKIISQQIYFKHKIIFAASSVHKFSRILQHQEVRRISRDQRNVQAKIVQKQSEIPTPTIRRTLNCEIENPLWRRKAITPRITRSDKYPQKP